MPTPNPTEPMSVKPCRDAVSQRPTGPNAQTLGAMAARFGTLTLGAGLAAPARALPFSPEALSQLERSWRLDAH